MVILNIKNKMNEIKYFNSDIYFEIVKLFQEQIFLFIHTNSEINNINFFNDLGLILKRCLS